MRISEIGQYVARLREFAEQSAVDGQELAAELARGLAEAVAGADRDTARTLYASLKATCIEARRRIPCGEPRFD